MKLYAPGDQNSRLLGTLPAEFRRDQDLLNQYWFGFRLKSVKEALKSFDLKVETKA